MKKGLLLVLAVLLVAGLFVSCNSDVSANAGASSKDYAYVTFDKASASKSVSPTVDPADAPSIDDLYWYYQATKASGTVHEGQTSGWTRVKVSGKGLSGTIGPFSVGEWYFALVGVAGTEAPSDVPAVTYTLNGNTVTWDNFSDASVKYIGISGTSGYTTKENVTLAGNQSDPTYIPMSLQQVNMTSKVTVKLDGLQLVGSSGITSGSNVWLDVLKGDSQLESTIEVTAGASGAVVPANTSRELELSSAVEQVTLNFKLYDKTGDNVPVVKEASVSFLATKGATVTLSGSLDAINVYGTFAAPNDAVAFVASSTGVVTFKDTLKGAIEDAATGDTVVLLKNVSGEGVSAHVDNKTITIEGNNKTITGSGRNTLYLEGDGQHTSTINVKNLNLVSTYSSTAGNSGYVLCFDELAGGTVSNCTITGNSIGLAVCGHSDSNSIRGGLVTVSDTTVNTTSENTSSCGIYNVALSSQFNSKLVVNSGTFNGLYSAGIYTSGGTIEIDGGTFSGPVLLYGNSGYSEKKRYSPTGEEEGIGAYGRIIFNNGTANLNAKTAADYPIINSLTGIIYPANGGFVFKDNNPIAAEVIVNKNVFSAAPKLTPVDGGALVRVLDTLEGTVIDTTVTPETEAGYRVYTVTTN